MPIILLDLQSPSPDGLSCSCGYCGGSLAGRGPTEDPELPNGCSCLAASGRYGVLPIDARFLESVEAIPGSLVCSSVYGNWRCSRVRSHAGDHAVTMFYNVTREQYLTATRGADLPEDQRGTLLTFPLTIFRWSEGTESRMPICRNCGENRVGCTECRSTNRCSACCACTAVPHRDQAPDLFLGEPSKRYPRYAGVEVECGKLPKAKVKGFRRVLEVAEKYEFRIGSDGSIHNFAKSAEISTTPARGDVLHNQLTELGEALIKDEMKANASCGFHVHVDVRDYTIEHLMAFVYLWDRLENCMYRLVSPSRRGNNYSRPWGGKFRSSGCLDTKRNYSDREAQLDTACYGSPITAEQYKSSRNRHESRYHGVNLNSITVHGTIEFRLHHGTVNPIKMKMWTAVCQALVEYAFRHSEEEIRSLKGTNTEIFEMILDDEEVISWTRARRLFFTNLERKNQGLGPVTKPARPAPGGSRRGTLPRKVIPVTDPGEQELSESP